ncbi:hypothetical protein ABZ901_10685 [Actinacidiphila alni]|nr:hypothetical protein [Actinacidiphila alni]
MSDETSASAEDKTIYQRESLEDEVMDEVLAAYGEAVEEERRQTTEETTSGDTP